MQELLAKVMAKSSCILKGDSEHHLNMWLDREAIPTSSGDVNNSILHCIMLPKAFEIDLLSQTYLFFLND